VDRDLENADPQWLVVEDGFAPARANAYETVFTTGNGYLGTRGSLEEGHEGALPGTYLRGGFDHHDSRVIELVKAPDWLSLAVVVDGTRLDVTSAAVVRHRRILDLRQGTLVRETVFARRSWSTTTRSSFRPARRWWPTWWMRASAGVTLLGFPAAPTAPRRS
jgi:trehalose/maltose hydrolase-like predicted phosphorylase